MKARLKQIGLGIVALALAGVIWLPCVHLFFTKPVTAFRATNGISPEARALAARHLQLWTDPALREVELRRMRGSNAEWDFMGRSFLVWSLANVGLRDPALKAACLDTMDRIIAETLEIEREHSMYHFLMSYAKSSPYVVQPARSLLVDGEIALMLATRRTLEEKEAFKPLLASRLQLITDGLAEHRVLESYPNECWTFDHAVALAAMRLADRLDGTDHSTVIQDWLAFAREKLVHRETGLLVSSFTTDGTPLDGPEGSSIWLVAHCLQVLDPKFARDQYERARRELGQTTCGFGSAREWPVSWHGPADIDSGPIIPVLNISAGSSGLALVGAAAFDDEAFLHSLLATLDFAAFPERSHGELKYCASNQVGDAVLLYAAVLGPLWEVSTNLKSPIGALNQGMGAPSIARPGGDVLTLAPSNARRSGSWRVSTNLKSYIGALNPKESAPARQRLGLRWPSTAFAATARPATKIQPGSQTGKMPVLLGGSDEAAEVTP